MQINVEAKPPASAAYDTRKKRLVETIDRLYVRDAKGSLQKMISRIHPADMAAILDDLPPAHVVDVFHSIADSAMASDVFNQLSPDLRTQVMTESPIEKLAGVLEHLPPDDLADLIVADTAYRLFMEVPDLHQPSDCPIDNLPMQDP